MFDHLEKVEFIKTVEAEGIPKGVTGRMIEEGDEVSTVRACGKEFEVSNDHLKLEPKNPTEKPETLNENS